MRTVHPVLAAQVLNKLLEGTSMEQIHCCELVRARACTCDDGEAIGILSLHALRSAQAQLGFHCPSLTAHNGRNKRHTGPRRLCVVLSPIMTLCNRADECSACEP